jgi:hypothetical protein
MHVEAHVAVRGIDKDAIGTAGDLEMSIRLDFGGGLVINDLVGVEDIVAIMYDYVAVEGKHIANS